MASLRDGLGTLVAALERELRADLRTSSDVTELRRNVREGDATWTIALSDGSEVEADAVICALPAHASARLVRSLDARLAERLRSIEYRSVATITAVFAASDLPKLPRCTGFVVPHIEHRNVLATTFSSQKFEHRSPEGLAVLRAFVGGALGHVVATASDDDLIDGVRTDFRELLGIAAEPQRWIVRRLPQALPEYAVGHADCVDAIERSAEGLGRFALAGSAYRGAGIADCVRSGERAAEAMVEATVDRPTMSTSLT